MSREAQNGETASVAIMDSYCKKLLSDGEYCYKPTKGSASFCEFHNRSYVERANVEILKRYISESDKERGIDFSRITFKGYHFTKDFEQLIEPKGRHVSFYETTFQDCLFRDISIHDAAFAASKFFNTRFIRVVFLGDTTNFSETVIEGNEPAFDYCQFEPTQGISFASATITTRDIAFRNTFINTEKCDFQDLSLHSERFYLYFQENPEPTFDQVHTCVRAKEIYLTGMKFYGHFLYTNGKSNACQTPPILLFSVINFSQMASATFLNANLERARFTYSRIDDAYFANVLWPTKGSSTRLSIYDDIEPVKDVTKDEVRRIYTQLKVNYERAREYVVAGHWHFREMEMQRQAAKDGSKPPFAWIRQNVLSWIGLYYIASRYGEDYVRPLVLTLLLGLAFSSFYMFSGFRLFGQDINYDWMAQNPFTLQHLCDIVKAVVFSAGTTALRLGDKFAPGGAETFLLSLLHTILSLSLISLFLLALRRRFRR